MIQRINGAAMSKLVAGLAVHEDLGVTEVADVRHCELVNQHVACQLPIVQWLMAQTTSRRFRE